MDTPMCESLATVAARATSDPTGARTAADSLARSRFL